MKSATGTLLLSAVMTTAMVGAPLATWEWDRGERTPGGPGEVVRVDGRAVLRLTRTNAEPIEVRLWTLEAPRVGTGTVYVVRGEVRSTDVRGRGFLEMWSVFPTEVPGRNGARYFSRTLEPDGSSAVLSGTSPWKGFELSFRRLGKPVIPERLEVNLHLPGEGTVEIGPLSLEAFPEALAEGEIGSSAASRGAWWSRSRSGLIGGLTGTFWGLLGAMVGVLTSLGRGRRVVQSLMILAMVAAAAGGVLGLAAWMGGQPAWVWYSLLFPAVLGGGVFGAQWSTVRRRFDEAELRRMRARDA